MYKDITSLSQIESKRDIPVNVWIFSSLVHCGYNKTLSSSSATCHIPFSASMIRVHIDNFDLIMSA